MNELDDLELLRAYEPVVRYNRGELFFPVAVEDHLACSELLLHQAGARSSLVLERGAVTVESLAAEGARRPGPGLYLRLVEEPFHRARVARWRLRSDRPRFRHASRLARVGVLSRAVDALNRVSLLFRGKVPRGTEAAAETLYREQMRDDHHPYYARVVRSGGYVALQYWFFYSFNDWRSRVYGVNDHEADWEQVVVYLAEQVDGSLEPAWVVFSAHDEVGDDLRRRWDDPELTRVGDHPVVFAGLGSHSGAFLRGEYVTSFDPPAFKGFIKLSRRVARTLLPWTRSAPRSGVGIPYVDYARGDGLAIGPGADRPWSPVLIDDETPWVFDYQGLWGNETADPLGGERGPAGPRYERSGAVRPSWGDVVGWAGLSKVAPNPQVAAALVRQRLDQLADERDEAAVRHAERRELLRADVASGTPVTPVAIQELDELARRRVELDDERRRLETRLSQPPPAPGPHDHLRHRTQPEPEASLGRQRLLSVWSAFSTPLLLVATAVAFVPNRSRSVVGAAALWFLVLFSLEALARKQLWRFILGVAVVIGLALLVAAAWSVVIVWGWRWLIIATLCLLALLLLYVNIQELSRD